MPEADLALLIDAARAAGKVATGFFHGPNQSWDKPDDAGPVTEADLAVNTLLEDHLRNARPAYGWLSEETEDDSDRLSREQVFIIDPIDGTRSFIQGAETWAHSLAIARDGVVTAGVVYLPLKELMFTASLGQGAFVNGEPLRAAACDRLNAADFLAARPALAPHHWPGGVPGFKRSYRPSLAYRMALVAQGRFDGMLTLRRAWEWDIAAGDILQREAGITRSDRTGAPLRFNNADPVLDGVVATNATLHGQVIDALCPA